MTLLTKITTALFLTAVLAFGSNQLVYAAPPCPPTPCANCFGISILPISTCVINGQIHNIHQGLGCPGGATVCYI